MVKFYFNGVFSFLLKNKVYSFLFILSFLSALRVLVLPLFGDELTYSNIAENIIVNGKYYLNNKASTLTPSMPLYISLFYLKSNPFIGFLLARMFNIVFIALGIRYFFKFLKSRGFSTNIVLAIILLCVVNTNFILWSLPLYPEALLFGFLWMFIWFASKKRLKLFDVCLIIISFIILTLTRYVFGVLGIIVIARIWEFAIELWKKNNWKELKKFIFISFILLVPVILWIKYILTLETGIKSGLDYFHRFKTQSLFYNIQAGLGLIKHSGSINVNGVPAFIALFIPMTALRNWFFSIILIAAYNWGFIVNIKSRHFSILYLSVCLLMSGLIFAGTGFSRYWIQLLPAFFIGFYLLIKSLKIRDDFFIFSSKIIALIYVINEIRLDYLILNEYVRIDF